VTKRGDKKILKNSLGSNFTLTPEAGGNFPFDLVITIGHPAFELAETTVGLTRSSSSTGFIQEVRFVKPKSFTKPNRCSLNPTQRQSSRRLLRADCITVMLF